MHLSLAQINTRQDNTIQYNTAPILILFFVSLYKEILMSSMAKSLPCLWVNPLLLFGRRFSTSIFRTAEDASSISVRRRRARGLAINSASASDVKYGCKQVISVTPRLYDYLLTNVREPKVKQTYLCLWVSLSLIIQKNLLLCTLYFYFYSAPAFQILQKLREETATMRGSQMQVLVS